MPPDLIPIRAALSGWDGRLKDIPLSVCARFEGQPGFLQQLEALVPDPRCADGATWCCKHVFENQKDLADVAFLITALSPDHGWAAKLHVLQLLPHWNGPLPKDRLQWLVTECTGSSRPMLRAWGYAGADILGGSFADFRPAMQSLLARAREVETAGSVRARLKRCTL